MPRLLYLCIQPRDRSPTQRYRFEQFEPYLHARGFDVEYASILTDEDVRTFYASAPAAAKAQVALRALARRAWSVLPRPRRPKYDVAIVPREAFFLFDAWSEWLIHLQTPVVFDFDDAIWIRTVSEANARFRSLKNVKKVGRIARLASTVIAGNDYLAGWARSHNPRVEVIPTSVDTERYTPGARSDEVVTIGWCGSASTIAHLRRILPVLERVQRTFGPRVRIRVMGDAAFRHEPLGLVGEAWSSAGELAFLQSIDIGVMPLPDDEWSRGKCGLKGLTSMACGAATVMSPVGVNATIVEHGKSGFLARSDDEWYQTLCTLIEDDALRRRLGAAGRDRVIREYSVARWRGPFVDAIYSAMEHRRLAAE